MRRVRLGEEQYRYEDYVRGDGTEFHYTWTETSKYRELYGYLDWAHLSNGEADPQHICTPSGQSVPLMMGSRRTAVTAMIHTEAISSDHGDLMRAVYARASEAITEDDTRRGYPVSDVSENHVLVELLDLLHHKVPEEMHSHFSRRHTRIAQTHGLPAQVTAKCELFT